MEYKGYKISKVDDKFETKVGNTKVSSNSLDSLIKFLERM